MSTMNNPEAILLAMKIALSVTNATMFFMALKNLMIWLNARIHDSTLFNARIQETVVFIPENITRALHLQVSKGAPAATNGLVWSSLFVFTMTLWNYF